CRELNAASCSTLKDSVALTRVDPFTSQRKGSLKIQVVVVKPANIITHTRRILKRLLLMKAHRRCNAICVDAVSTERRPNLSHAERDAGNRQACNGWQCGNTQSETSQKFQVPRCRRPRRRASPSMDAALKRPKDGGSGT